MKLFFLTLFSFLLLSCSKPYLEESSAFILFKTPSLKYADFGFIYKNKEEVKVQLYSNGNSILKFKLFKNSICLNSLACISYNSFYKEYFSKEYPKEMLNNIFRAKPIFNSLNLKRDGNNFTQKIFKKGKYDINYRVLNKEIYFNDKILNNIIKIKSR